MANPLFNLLNGGNGGGLLGSIMQMLPGMKQNPGAALQRAGYNVPQGMSAPQQILQHLVQSGQINQNQLNFAQQMAQQLGIK